MKTTPLPPGFRWGPKLVLFVQTLGKNIDGKQILQLHFGPRESEIVTFETQSGFEDFLAESSKYTFSTYLDFLKHFEAPSKR